MRKSWIVYIILILVLAGLGYNYYMRQKYSKMGQMMPPMGLQNVTVVAIKKETVNKTIDLPARINAFKISEVKPQVDGILKEIKFEGGTFVKEGQQLYQIDPTLYQIAYEAATTNIKAVAAKKKRYDKLIKTGAISRQEYDDVLASYMQLKAEIKRAQTSLSYTKVLAPISGYIGKSNITEGALLSVGSSVLTTIAQLDPIYVDMVLPSSEALKLNDYKDLTVNLEINNISYNQNGVLKITEVFADETSDSIRLRAVFDNPDHKLLPGMFANAKINLPSFDAVVVPQRATIRTPNGSLGVFVVGQDNIAKMRVIKAEQAFKDNWIVSEGLQEGEVIVFEGYQKIADGATVVPVMRIEEKKAFNENKAETKVEVKAEEKK